MRNPLRKRTTLLVTIGVTAAALGTGSYALTRGSGDTTVYGTFADANPIIAGDTVRSAGVEVGTVQSVTLVNGQARVALRLNPSVLPLHDNASLAIKPVSLLGEGYIELNTGSASAPYVTGPAVIPESRTTRSVTLQDIFNTLNDPTSTSLAAMLTALGDGMNGQGQNVAGALKSLKPALTSIDQLGQVLDSQNSVLNDLIDKAQPVASALDTDQGRSLNRLVSSTEQILSAVTANEQRVDQSLARLPATLTKAESAFASVAALSASATPTLAAVRPVTDNLNQIAAELDDFSKAANPALARLAPVLQKAQAMLDQARPLVDQAGPAAADLAGDARSLKPLGQMAVRNLNDIMTFVKWWAMSTNNKDGISNYFRGVLVATPASLTAGTTGTLPASRSGKSPGGPSLPGVPQVQVPKVQVPKLPSLNSGSGGSVTGLTGTQEKSMLNQLLGGQ